MKKNHRYKITVDYLADKEGNPPENPTSATFEIGNHDEIIGIMNRIGQRTDLGFDENTAASFALGLKLFSEVCLTHRKHPLFEEFGPHFGEFMKKLKGGSSSQG